MSLWLMSIRLWKASARMGIHRLIPHVVDCLLGQGPSTTDTNVEALLSTARNSHGTIRFSYLPPLIHPSTLKVDVHEPIIEP
jgi:hypothetical protein